MNLTLHIWRQAKGSAQGAMKTYQVKGVSEHASFLEMLDVLNEQLQERGEEPVAFDSDCREGICGMCSLVINGRPHGPDAGTTTCQLHMRRFKNGDEIYVEPFRAGAFPVVRDLCVDRNALDKIIAAGGYVTANVGSAPDANAVPIPKEQADRAFDAAACIGCGACVAACPNSSAMLFTAAKIAHLAHLPQGQPERLRRVKAMVNAMDAAGFGNCSNHYECEAACPKGISKDYIALMNRDYAKSTFVAKDAKAVSDGAG
ncbi:MAG: succinate dehydrogenase/fumarate reductase iron-sulfur subunit [Kofleriaceae bacterium]|nr:succinate dehydrogenase/fumarate reductase iron-sulfur subunit [Kofleriaceae bacterium]MBP9168289.1 succinate dehydrogenase/fumarate reductase iron-sulfur subunit [Kofleriaceae bacterium]MBP9862877.1 succinate dehydrogenase/fumarate reductase iron-sulfur subunit [Kofleriaceae bacterium]